MVLVDKCNLDIPEFIDDDFLKKSIESGFNMKNIEITKVSFAMGSIPGENFLSTIYRAHVVYTEGNSTNKIVDLIIKSLAKNVFTEHFQKNGVFDREAEIYIHALPKIQETLNGEDIAPKFFYFTKNPIETMVLQDVTSWGYALADRVLGLDEEHSALVLRKLAKYHAASMNLISKHPEVYEKFKTSVMSSGSSILDDNPKVRFSFDLTLEYLQELVDSWPGFESIAEKLRKFIKNIGVDYRRWFRQADKELKVLSHSDIWTNNILFRYDKKKPKDLYFIDFQMTFFSSPGIDITHFLYTSPQYLLLETRRDFMIEEYYYKTFQETLKNIGYAPVPTLEEILDEITNREICGFLMAAIKLYVICMEKDKSEENSFDTMADADHGRKLRVIGMSSDRYIKTMKYILKRLNRVGKLD